MFCTVRDGSIIVEFKLIFMKKVENPLRPLAEATKTGMLGNMTVTMANKKGKINLDIKNSILLCY